MKSEHCHCACGFMLVMRSSKQGKHLQAGSESGRNNDYAKIPRAQVLLQSQGQKKTTFTELFFRL